MELTRPQANLRKSDHGHWLQTEAFHFWKTLLVTADRLVRWWEDIHLRQIQHRMRHLCSPEPNLVHSRARWEMNRGVLRLSVQPPGTGADHETRNLPRVRAPHVNVETSSSERIETCIAAIREERRFPEYKVAELRPCRAIIRRIYARGRLGRGQSAFAVLGRECAADAKAAMDAALTFGMLGLACWRRLRRERQSSWRLKTFLPWAYPSSLARPGLRVASCLASDGITRWSGHS
jgi:hypothetical protein